MHLHGEQLEQYVLGDLPEDLSAEVESHLKTCVACVDRLEQSLESLGEWAEKRPYTGPEKRADPRMEANASAILTVIRQEPSPRLKMRVLEASRQGLKLLVPEELMTGEMVQLYVRDLFILAEVRNCRKVGKAFHAGVQIQDVFPAAG